MWFDVEFPEILRRSLRKVTRELMVGRESLCNLVRIDLGLVAHSKDAYNTISHQLFERNGSKDAGAFYGGSDEFPMTKIFSHVRFFTVQELSNRQNYRIFVSSSKSISSQLKFTVKLQNPLYIMAWADVFADSKKNLVFIPRGVRINTGTYKELIP